MGRINATRWEGSRAFAPTVRLADAIVSQAPALLTDEESLLGRALAGMLGDARVVGCPPEQLNAISDDVFQDVGQAFEYAAMSRMPFPVTFFDFTDASGRAPTMHLHLVEEGGADLGFELRAVIVAEAPDERQTSFLPVIGARGAPPEELGAAFVRWDADETATAQPHRWIESLPGERGQNLRVTMMNVAAAMEACGERPRAVSGGLMGCLRHEQATSGGIPLQMTLATATASAVRTALKVLYLLDSANVELDRTAVTRQVRREAQRSGAEIAWVVKVRAPNTREKDGDTRITREFSHRFEVRGNFAHHREGSWLYEHSAPEDIRPCPRCGQCRRIWRSAHVKGPLDRPLAVKIRHVDFPPMEERGDSATTPPSTPRPG
jgi:hypothetical protein